MRQILCMFRLFFLATCAYAAHFSLFINRDSTNASVHAVESAPIFLLTSKIDARSSLLPRVPTPLFVRFDAQPWQRLLLPPRSSHWAATPLPSEPPLVPLSVTVAGAVKCADGGASSLAGPTCVFTATLRLPQNRSSFHWDLHVTPFLAPPIPCAPRRFACLPAERNGTVAVPRWAAVRAVPSPPPATAPSPHALSRRSQILLALLLAGVWARVPAARGQGAPRRAAIAPSAGARSSSAGRAAAAAAASIHAWGGAASSLRARSVGPSEAQGAAHEPPLGGAFEMLVTTLVLRARQQRLLGAPRLGAGAVSVGGGVARQRLGE